MCLQGNQSGTAPTIGYASPNDYQQHYMNQQQVWFFIIPTYMLFVPAFNNPDTWDIAKFFPLLPLLSSVFLGYLLIVFLLFKYLYLSIYDVIMECFVLQQMLGGVRPFPHAQQRQQVPNSVSL